jgi:ribonucleoside-diphosphate reductase alpha chain
VEPVFDFEYSRRVRQPDGSHRDATVTDFAYAVYRAQVPGAEGAPLPSAFVTAGDLQPSEHLAMQAALQRHVDSSISKTINCPVDLPFETFQDVYLQAYALGLKGCTTFRPNPVTGAVLTAGSDATTPTVPEAPPAAVGATSPAAAVAPSVPSAHPIPVGVATDRHIEGGAGVVYMSRPLERDTVLGGYTYKLKWPGSDHAIYVTINDIERDGRRRPFEIFINTKNLEHYAWTVALTRMISAVFRRGGDVTFVVEELKAVFDPQGGHWIAGRYVPSLLAAIGEVIEAHMRRTGFLQPEGASAEAPDRLSASMASQPEISAGAADDAVSERVSGSPPGAREGSAQPRASTRTDAPRQADEPRGSVPPRDGTGSQTAVAKACPRCYRPGLVKHEGCWVCHTCGYSRCG